MCDEPRDAASPAALSLGRPQCGNRVLQFREYRLVDFSGIETAFGDLLAELANRAAVRFVCTRSIIDPDEFAEVGVTVPLQHGMIDSSQSTFLKFHNAIALYFPM